MFDISWTEILIIGIVALLVVGPKELPALLRTIGRYFGVVRKQAAEFRAQFEEAMRETEIEQLRKDVLDIKTSTEASLRESERSVEAEINDAKREFDATTETVKVEGPDPDGHDADGLPKVAQSPAANGGAGQDVNGAAVPPDTARPAEERPAEEAAPKSGA
jgi:sec-independent protein translocase protein TatB